jgi:hypothetical protein
LIQVEKRFTSEHPLPGRISYLLLREDPEELERIEGIVKQQVLAGKELAGKLAASGVKILSARYQSFFNGVKGILDTLVYVMGVYELGGGYTKTIDIRCAIPNPGSLSCAVKVTTTKSVHANYDPYFKRGKFRIGSRARVTVTSRKNLDNSITYILEYEVFNGHVAGSPEKVAEEVLKYIKETESADIIRREGVRYFWDNIRILVRSHIMRVEPLASYDLEVVKVRLGILQFLATLAASHSMDLVNVSREVVSNYIHVISQIDGATYRDIMKVRPQHVLGRNIRHIAVINNEVYYKNIPLGIIVSNSGKRLLDSLSKMASLNGKVKRRAAL